MNNNASSPVIFSLLLTFDFTFARANLLLMENVLSRTSQQHRGKVFGMAEWMKLFVGFFSRESRWEREIRIVKEQSHPFLQV